VDLDEEMEKRKERLYVPNWFSVEVKTGVCAMDHGRLCVETA